MDQSYIDLLSGQGVSQAWVDIDEFNPLVDEATPDNPTQEDVFSGPKRKLNFSDEEDKALSSAWCSIGMDSITGNQQKGSTYWARIHQEFENNLGRRSDRTKGSLSHRWGIIASSVSKWSACYEAIQKKNASGTNIEDKNGAAHAMYKRLYKKKFTLMHCWLLLRHYPKWNSTLTFKRAKKGSSDSPGSSTQKTFSSNNMEDDTPQECTEINRPIGRKAAKGKKRSGLEDQSSSFHTAIEATQETRLAFEQKKDERFEKLMSMEQARLELERRREELERSREERSIMDIDLDKLTGSRLEYYRHLQEQIVQRKRNAE